MATVLGALDVGTQTTRLAVGEYVKDELRILACTTTPTSGMKKGIIRNLDDVVKGIKTVLREMSKAHHIDISEVMVNFSSAGVKAVSRRGRLSLMQGHVITEEDIRDAEENAIADEAPDAAEVVLQRLRQRYEVNGQPVTNPLGMTGTELVAKVLEVSAPRSEVESLHTAVRMAELRTEDVIFSGFASAESVLDNKARDDGTLVIDVGAGTVSYMAVCNGIVAAVGTIGIGGHNLTNDLALAFQISQEQAEAMKLARGAAIIQPDLASNRYQLRTPFSTSERSVSVHAIQTVTTERMDETFRLIRDQLSANDLLSYLRGSVILTVCIGASWFTLYVGNTLSFATETRNYAGRTLLLCHRVGSIKVAYSL